MEKKHKIIVAVVALVVAIIAIYFFSTRDQRMVDRVEKVKEQAQMSDEAQALDDKNVSPISGISCENWNKRPIAVMQPADVQARPAAGFSAADMVFEMPAFTSSVTRLMGVYICDVPDEIGAIRSARHDYIPLAKGLDAVFVHWGGSIFALDKLKGHIIDNIECLVYSGKYCDRWDYKNIAGMRKEDSSHVKKEKLMAAISDLGYRTESQLERYPHQIDAPIEKRPEKGHLRVGFAGPYEAEYDYDKNSNSYLRIWGDKDDVDRNNGERIAPKNVVVMIAKSEQIALDTDYDARGVDDPWDIVPEVKKTGDQSIDFRYNDVQIGDPWFDVSDSGEAHYYFNGKDYRGTWKKDKSDMGSKLFFYDQSGDEIKFVPGQVWVEILEPGQALKWSVE
ncbi:DUF3048 domain-containing protein [Patescibacteria group bacterium]